MGRIKDSKGLYVAISILLAIIFWLYVRAENDIPMENQVRGIPIQITNEDVLESRGLMVSEIDPETINITFEGSSSVVPRLNRNNVTVSVDVSRITSEGSYDLTYTVAMPTNLNTTGGSGITRSSDVETIRVTVVPLYTRELSIEGTFVGEVADGYQAGELEITPETVTISGEESAVNQVARAVVEVGGDALTETYTGDLPITLLDRDGNVIEDDRISLSVDTALVILPVQVVRDVPLTVNLLPGGGISQEDIDRYVKVEIEPAAISVAGSAEDLEAITSISLGDIDLSTVLTTSSVERNIEIANELTNISGVSRATVTITVQGLEMRTVSVSNFELRDVSAGYHAEIVTQSIDIQIRGPQESLDQISPSQILVVGDLTDIVSATGRYTVPARVYLNGPDDVGVVGEYTVTVQVTR